ncbi:hypothetical protein [Paraburkholderia sp. 35.1]|uniref:hypothetical protein n=1 Tax=Paraburkholderia sp. 35.1 TaxID=2991058 RepID=UPI003D1DDC90
MTTAGAATPGVAMLRVVGVPDGERLFAVWERAEREHPLDRALSILEAFTHAPRATLAALSIQRRDELLIASRIAAFGARLDGVGQCEVCACKTDITVDLGQCGRADAREHGTVTVGGRTVGFRVPNSYDLAAIARCDEPQMAARALIERCRLPDSAAPLSEDKLAVPLAEAIGDGIERLCDGVSIELAMDCPECGGASVLAVDIGEFLWDELSASARRLIEDVDALASAYGWAEAAILAMPEARRRRYLEFVR